MDLKQALFATRTKFRRQKVELSAELTALVDGAEFHVREMTAAERGVVEMARHKQTKDAKGKVVDVSYDLTADRERVVVRCLCDEKGNRVLEDDDAAAVSQLPSDLIDALYTAAKKVNGLDRDRDEELEKNSPGRNGALHSGSPSRAGAST